MVKKTNSISTKKVISIIFLTTGIAVVVFQICKRLFYKPLSEYFYISEALKFKRITYCIGYIIGYNATLILGLILMLVGYLMFRKKSK
jgi:hypothetical protein